MTTRTAAIVAVAGVGLLVGGVINARRAVTREPAALATAPSAPVPMPKEMAGRPSVGPAEPQPAPPDPLDGLDSEGLAAFAVAKTQLSPPDLKAAREALARVPDANRDSKAVRKAEAAYSKAEKKEALARKLAARTMRRLYAEKLDGDLISGGIEGSIKATGDEGTTLRIETILCGRVFLNRMFGGAKEQGTLHTLGFKRIACNAGFTTTTIDFEE